MGKGAKGSGGKPSAGNGFQTIDVDPRRVRYAHSKIKPMFSGCGRTIEQTLTEIREGKTSPTDIPAITVILGPVDPADGQPCYFSLNNRRLFVFKACREESLLGSSGLVRVRARGMKAHERERYTLDRCSLQAKFLFAAKPSMVSTGASEDSAAGGPRASEEEGEVSGADTVILARSKGKGTQDIEKLIGKCSVQDGDEASKEMGSGESVGKERASSRRLNTGVGGGTTSGSSRSRGGCGAGREREGVVLAGGVLEGEFDGVEATRKQERSRKGRRRKTTAPCADT